MMKVLKEIKKEYTKTIVPNQSNQYLQWKMV